MSRGFTDAADTEPLGVASADKPKAAIPKSSSLDIPAAAAAAGSSSLKTSSGLGKVWNVTSDLIAQWFVTQIDTQWSVDSWTGIAAASF